MPINQLEQNNPILYIFLGNVNRAIYEGIANAHKKRIGTEGIGYIGIGKEDSEEIIIGKIKQAYAGFMTKKYLYAGELRINYVLSVHDPFAVNLEDIRKKIEAYMGYLYPVGILTDIFALIDDRAAALLESGETTDLLLDMLAGLANETLLVYLLSNVGSNSIYEDGNIQNIIYSIALIALVKDFSPLKGVHNAPRYNENYFRDDSRKRGGSFMSIGYSNIKKPTEIIKKILLTKLLMYMDKEHIIKLTPDLRKISKSISAILALERNNLMGLTVNKNDARGLNNIQAVKMLFGDRLDMYFALNFTCEDREYTNTLEKQIDGSVKGFFEAYYLTKHSGTLYKYYESLRAQSDMNFNTWHDEFDEWGNQRLQHSGKFYPYELAAEYLSFKWKAFELEKIREDIEDGLKRLKAYHANLHKTKIKIDALVAENNKAISTLESALPFMNHSVRAYYESELVSYIEGHFAEYMKIYHSMFGMEFEHYVEILTEYIEKTLLASEIFQKPITDETAEILRFNNVSDNEIFTYILNWIVQNKKYNIFLKTGDKHLHSEINILIDVNSKFIANIGKEKVYLFYQNDENEIDILYHIGGFVKQELYYAELYTQNSYEFKRE